LICRLGEATGTSIRLSMRKRAGENDAPGMSSTDDSKLHEVEASLPAGVGVTLVAVLKNLALSIISPTPTVAITRTAIFLLVFTTVHMLGNITMFIGPDAFNGYGYFLRNNPAINLIEAYLGLGLVIHSVVAVYLSYKKWSTIKKNPLSYGKLLASSIFVTAFLVVHLKNFRFGEEYDYHIVNAFTIPIKGTVAAGTKMRDIYKTALEVFANKAEVAFYVISVIVLAFHMWHGWPKAVAKMSDIPKAHKQTAILFGHLLAVIITVGFVSCPLYIHFMVLQK